MYLRSQINKNLRIIAMSTIIYPSPIFGPVHSRRLGVSLGINLLPSDGKICTFDCIYCECGLNADHRPKNKVPTREEVAGALEIRLRDMLKSGLSPDVLTFAGNGEPTCHPQFAAIIEDTVRLRDKYFPRAKISVLTNATLITRDEVHQALMRVDNNICKLDTVDMDYIHRVDRPSGEWYKVEDIIEGMKRFHGHVIIQTMFMKGMITVNGALPQDANNIGEEYVAPWLETVKEIRPQQVMIYTIDRESPDKGLLKASPEELNAIRDRVIAAGIPCSASY